MSSLPKFTINFKNCTSKDCTALVTELNESLKKIEKLPNSSSEAGDTTESCDVMTVEEKKEAEKKDEAYFTTVINVDDNTETEREGKLKYHRNQKIYLRKKKENLQFIISFLYYSHGCG